jgi:hypothetical protein
LLNVGHFVPWHLNQVRNCQKLKGWHSLPLVWLKSFFLPRLNSWVSGAFLCANHFPRWHLNPGPDHQTSTDRRILTDIRDSGTLIVSRSGTPMSKPCLRAIVSVRF